jgi:hypothetical protein
MLPLSGAVLFGLLTRHCIAPEIPMSSALLHAQLADQLRGALGGHQG